MGLIEFVETGAFRLAQSSQHGGRIGDFEPDLNQPVGCLPVLTAN